MNNIHIKINLNSQIKIEEIHKAKQNFKKNNISINILGNVYNKKEKRITPNEIYDLYIQHKRNISKFIEGTYAIIIIDYDKDKIYIHQDFFGNCQYIYFYKDKNEIIISNRLRTIILNKEINWKLNYNATKKFIKKGYIVGKNTLIKNIYKIPGKKELKIDLKRKKIKLERYKKERLKKEHISLDKYNETFEKVTLSSIHEDLGITISSGYDTNYLLYNIRKKLNKPINAFCIGGRIGRNEIPIAQKICEQYPNMKFFSKLVDGDSLIKYPEIIFALEGAIYESGIFLQYELSKLVNKSGNHNIVLGECADQVLNYELYHPFMAVINKIKYNKSKIIKKLIKNIDYKPYKDVYEMASYKIIKKNGILMNYFGLNPEYPYLRTEFIKIAKNVVELGDKEKIFHKKVIDNTLSSNVSKMLQKIGGATELKTLFIGNIELNDIKDLCKKSKFFKNKTFDDKFYEIDYYMKILYLELFEKIFLEKNSKKILEDKIDKYDIYYFFPNLKK